MIRLFHVYFPARTLLLAGSEACLIVLALLAATSAWSGKEADLLRGDEYNLVKIALASAVCFLCMYYYDLYDSSVLSRPFEVLARLVQVLGTACVILAVLYYAYPAVQLGRGAFLVWIALAGVGLGAWRTIFLALERSSRLAQRTIFLGESPLAHSLAAEMERRPELGVDLLGLIDRTQEAAGGANGLRLLGGLEDLSRVIEGERIERIVVTMADRRGGLPVQELLRLKTKGVRVEDGPDVYEAITGKVPLESLRLSWLLFSPGFRVSRAMLVYKRAASLIGSLLGLAAALPLMGLIAVAIRLDSSGAVIFRQKRLGKDGRIFTLYKFRSMRQDAEGAENPLPAQRHDPRVTRVGRWLRRSRLDELPQLYNILRGDMYFVGPRPFTSNMEQEYARLIPFYTQRWSIKPGATGWAQIQRGYCASLQDNRDKLSCDLYYIKNMSLGLDLLILFQTMKIVLLGRGSR